MFGERINQVRKKLKLSQAEFAKNLGISRGHISKLENGLAVPSRPLMTLISEIYLVRLEWLVDGIGPMELDFKKDARIVQRVTYSSLLKNLDLFLQLHSNIILYAIETLRDGSKNIIPEFCPPELLDRLRQILELPYEDLLALVRQILSACEAESDG